MVRIRKNLKVAHNRQKSYVNKNRTFKEFKVWEHVFLKVKARKSSLKLRSCKKLAARYFGPFEILNKIELVAYELMLPPNIKAHNIFHVYLLKKYVHDSNHAIDWSFIQVELEGDFQVQLVCIMDKKVTMLRNIAIGQVKV